MDADNPPHRVFPQGQKAVPGKGQKVQAARLQKPPPAMLLDCVSRRHQGKTGKPVVPVINAQKRLKVFDRDKAVQGFSVTHSLKIRLAEAAFITGFVQNGEISTIKSRLIFSLKSRIFRVRRYQCRKPKPCLLTKNLIYP
jgi:hypothetical protein